jgi:hypothetical protein
VIVVVAPTPPEPSFAVNEQNPGVVEAVYVTLALPVASVLTVLVLRTVPFSVPHAADGTVNVTGSLTTAAPVTSLTVAVTVEVLVPLAARLDGTAVSVIVFGTAVWWTRLFADELLPLASRAATLQSPALVAAV